MRSFSATAALGPVTSHLRTVSAPLPGARPHSFAMSAADRLLPIASPRSSRSCFSSGPVTREHLFLSLHLTNDLIAKAAAVSDRPRHRRATERLLLQPPPV